MRKFLLWAIALFVIACGGTPLGALGDALDVVRPPAFKNPVVLSGVPWCTASLTDEQRAKVAEAFRAWNTAYPPLKLTTTTLCNDLYLPRVRVVESLGAGGYAEPHEIQVGPDAPQCTYTHEAGHISGLYPHGGEGEPPGAMSDTNRGTLCLPSRVDEWILQRTYGGESSRVEGQ